MHSSACAQRYVRKRIQHEFEERIDKYVPRVTVMHHEAELVMSNNDP